MFHFPTKKHQIEEKEHGLDLLVLTTEIFQMKHVHLMCIDYKENHFLFQQTKSVSVENDRYLKMIQFSNTDLHIVTQDRFKIVALPWCVSPCKASSLSATRVPNSLPMGANSVDYEPQGTEVIQVCLQTTSYIDGSRGVLLVCAPPQGSRFFHFDIQILRSYLGSWCPPMKLAPPMGNPGSATALEGWLQWLTTTPE